MNELPEEITYKLTNKSGKDQYLTVSRIDLVDWNQLFATCFANATNVQKAKFKYGRPLVTLTLKQLANDQQIGLYARQEEIKKFFETTWMDNTDRLDSFILLFSNNVKHEAAGTYHIITKVDSKNGEVFTRVIKPSEFVHIVYRKPEDADEEMEN